MNDVCILFSYYRDDRTTWHNYEVLRRSNPDVDVYPVLFNCLSTPCLPNSFTYRDTCPVLVQESRWLWRNADLVLYDFFRHQPQPYQRYLYLEWDTLCNIDVRELYRAEWDQDLVAKTVWEYAGADKDWYWFPKVGFRTIIYVTPERLLAAAPLCGVLLSARCLAAATENVLLHYEAFRDVFCEVRVATAAALAGYRVTTASRLRAAPTFEWTATPFQESMLREPGIHHAIKEIP